MGAFACISDREKRRGNKAKQAKKNREKETEQNRAKNGFQQFDGAVSGSRIGRRMAIHSLQPREAEQPSAIGSNLLLPFAAIGSPCSLPLDLPVSPSPDSFYSYAYYSSFHLLMMMAMMMTLPPLSITTTDTIIIPIQIDTLSHWDSCTELAGWIEIDSLFGFLAM